MSSVKIACSTGYATVSTGATNSSQCSVCNVGYYMSDSTCVQCPSGYATVSTGATSSSQCSACSVGYLMSNGQCNVCNVGYYMSGSTCVQCPSGFTTASTGSSSVDQCMYLCTSAVHLSGCCRSRVLIASSVTSIGILYRNYVSLFISMSLLSIFSLSSSIIFAKLFY